MSVEVSQLTYSASEPTWTDKLSTINQTAKDKVYAVMAPQDAAILIGMVLGGYEGIDSTTVRNFSSTGLVHILSVSGSHIALLVGFVLSLCHMLKLPRQLTVVLAAVIIIFYTLLCGFSPPVLRSCRTASFVQPRSPCRPSGRCRSDTVAARPPYSCPAVSGR